jgi:arginyl-tRNA synthetase
MVKDQILALLKSAGVDASEQQVEKPPSSDFGDLSFPCFPLAKVIKKNPVQIAEEIAKKIKIPKNSIVSKIESKSGYVNFFFNYPKFSKLVLSGYKKKIDIGKGKKVMVEYSQPNPVHPIHIGHARSTFLGDSLAKILEYVGYNVERANYMNDVGLQVAKLVLAYKKWANNKSPQGKSDKWLWQYYVKFHEEAQKNEKLNDEAKNILLKYEVERDKSVSDLWNKIVKWCVDGFEKTYKRIGVNFDVYFYENEFREAGRKLAEETLEKGISKKTEDGAIFADLEKYGVPGTILLRSNGTGLYITSDLSLTIHKFSKYKLDKSIWVVSSQQDLNFKQLFKLLELLGHDFYKNCYHFSYEWVNLPEGKMSSREGRAIMVDDVVDKLIDLALGEVKKRNEEMKESEQKKIAEQIGIGAFKYAIVRIETNNQIIFDWEQMLRLDGNTGPYLQYAHTRCNSILKKAGKFKKTNTSDEMNDEEKKLVRSIYEFQNIVKQSASEMKPHLICNYAYDLATIFNSFYQSTPVLKSDEKKKNFRLTLVKSTSDILETCLNLVGINSPEKM